MIGKLVKFKKIVKVEPFIENGARSETKEIEVGGVVADSYLGAVFSTTEQNIFVNPVITYYLIKDNVGELHHVLPKNITQILN